MFDVFPFFKLGYYIIFQTNHVMAQLLLRDTGIMIIFILIKISVHITFL